MIYKKENKEKIIEGLPSAAWGVIGGAIGVFLALGVCWLLFWWVYAYMFSRR